MKDIRIKAREVNNNNNACTTTLMQDSTKNYRAICKTIRHMKNALKRMRWNDLLRQAETDSTIDCIHISALASACVNSVYHTLERVASPDDMMSIKQYRLDHMQTAYMAILEQFKRQTDGGETRSLTRPYKERVLHGQIIIVNSDKKDVYLHDRVITPIQSIMRSIRNDIASYNNPVDNSKYSYIQDVLTDTDNDNAEYTVYKRMPRYYDIGGHVIDFNGKQTVYTVGDSEWDAVDRIIADLNLSDLQSQVLHLRLQGRAMTEGTISRTIGVSENSVKSAIRELRKKARAYGYNF